MANSATIPGNMQPTGLEQKIANYMCDAMCDAIGKKSSDELEDDLKNDPNMKKWGVDFKKFGYVNVPKGIPKKFGRAVKGAFERAGKAYEQVAIWPDAILGATMGGASGNQIMVQGDRCFEIKLPGDKVGRGTNYADQLDRQSQLAGGKRPIVIACPGHPNHGVCTSCSKC